MVLQVLYRLMPRVRALWVVLLRLRSMMLRVAVAQVALFVVLLLMLVMRALQAMLRFTVRLVLMMMRVLLVVLVWVYVWAVSGLCSGISVPGRGPGGRRCWPVLLALTRGMRRS